MSFWKTERQAGMYYIYYSLFMSLILVTFMFGFAYWALEIHHKGWKKTSGKIIKLNGNCNVWSDKHGQHYDCPVTINYNVNGKDYNTLSSYQAGDSPAVVGTIVSVYYNPYNPNQIDPSEGATLFIAKICFVFGILISLMNLFIYKYRNNKYVQMWMGFQAANAVLGR